MSQFCWYYTALQALILILIYQAMKENRNLNEDYYLLTHKVENGRRGQRPRVNCISHDLLREVRELRDIFQRNVYGSGYIKRNNDTYQRAIDREQPQQRLNQDEIKYEINKTRDRETYSTGQKQYTITGEGNQRDIREETKTLKTHDETAYQTPLSDY